MPSSVIIVLLTVAVAAVLAADPDASGSATDSAEVFADRGRRGTPAVALRRAPLDSAGRPRPRVLVLLRPRAESRGQHAPAELDGLVERSRLFTADPEAASAGKLYRQLALYPTAPAATPDGAVPQELEGETSDGDALAEEEYLLDDGDFGRRLQPGGPSTALPAYPPYSHGPLAVPIEPYRSPEYGPVSGDVRQRPPVALEPRQTVRPTSQPTPPPTPEQEPETPDVPLQSVEEEPPVVAPEPETSVRQQEPVEYPARNPALRHQYLPRLPVEHRGAAPVSAKPTQGTNKPLKTAAPPPHKSGSVYYPPRPYHSDLLNEVSSGPLPSSHGPRGSLTAYRPARLRPDRPGIGSAHLGRGSGRYHHPHAEYRHYTGLRQAKKSGGFERVRPDPYRYESEPAEVSYGARTGDDGAFEWFSDYPVGSSHH